MRHGEGFVACMCRPNSNAQRSNIDMVGMETTNTRAPCPSVRVITQDAKNMMSVRSVRSRTTIDKIIFMRTMVKQTVLFVSHYVHHVKSALDGGSTELSHSIRFVSPLATAK